MKRIILTALCLLTLSLQAQEGWPQGVVYDSAWRDDVKTVQLYRPGAELDFPLLIMGQESQLVLEFDVMSDVLSERGGGAEALQWRIYHCDRHWVCDKLEASDFLSGFAEGTVEEFDFSFTTRRDYVHYRCVLPGPYAEFILSGNYIVEVRSQESDAGSRRSDSAVLLTRRFCVSEQGVRVSAEVGRSYDGVDLDRRQEVDVRVDATGVNEQWLTVTVQQNGRLDNRCELVLSGYDGRALAFRQRKENIFDGGNTFRYFDCSNLRTPMYNVARVEEYGGEQFVLLRPEEDRSRKHFLTETTLNGGMKVNVWDRDNPRLEADYVWVNFSLPMAQPMLEGNVYIVGALTNWRLDEGSRMEYNPKHKAYTKRLLLKQGYYAYQLLVSNTKGGRIDGRSATAALEGDHRETHNRYTIFVYQHGPSDVAERLVAVSTAVGGVR